MYCIAPLLLGGRRTTTSTTTLCLGCGRGGGSSNSNSNIKLVHHRNQHQCSQTSLPYDHTKRPNHPPPIKASPFSSPRMASSVTTTTVVTEVRNETTCRMETTKMETALDVLTRCLQGDSGARSFLDQTAKVYVLDATSATPKLFGCWNFLHQAMNEVERMESALVLANDDTEASLQLQAQTHLLARFAVQVARRSQTHDVRLVNTCLDNYMDVHGTSKQTRLQHLIEENSRLRDIVMGRIAAQAFDSSGDEWIHVVACNAVSNHNVSHLLCEWIIPTHNLQPLGLATLVLDIAQEAQRVTSPAGTTLQLQQLSAPCLQHVLARVLANHRDDVPAATAAIRALQAWLQTTHLSLAQAQHLCSKVKISLVEVLSDAMYSNDPTLIDAVADLLEFAVQEHPPREYDNEDRSDDFYITPNRFQQTRFIMGVTDEASFKANVTAQQLYTIENKELGTILEELASAVALQRFRFAAHTERSIQQQQQPASVPVCRNLARICVAVCNGYEKIAASLTQNETPTAMIPSPGCLELLTKCISHPDVQICAMALPVVTPLLASQVGLATQFLPMLQRRAIVPHTFAEGETVPSLASSPMEFQDFCRHFRDTVLADALVACFHSHAEYYLASCTAAIEEFCTSGESNNPQEVQKQQQQTSFHLEAALYCMAVVAEDSSASIDTGNGSAGSNKANECLERCTAALAQKPKSLSNPLTLQQACHFIRKYGKFFSANEPEGVLDVAAELSLFIFTQCATEFPNEPLSIAVRRDCGVTPFTEAAKTLEELLCHNPTHFLSNKAIAALGAGWEATFTACNRSKDLLTNDDRIAICTGICHVLAALPEAQRATSLMALAMPVMGCLDNMIQRAESVVENEQLLDSILERASSEIVVLTALCRAYTDAATTDSSREPTSDTHAALVVSALEVLRRSWDQIGQAAARWSFHESMLQALGYFLMECTPPESNDDASLSLLDELCAVAKSIVDSPHAKRNEHFFSPVFAFLIQCIRMHGNAINMTAHSIQDGRSTPSVGDRDKEATKWIKFMIVHTLETMDDRLGIPWATAQQQGIGQPAFEIKTRPLAAAESSSLAGVTDVGLPSLFSLFRLIAERCPYVLLQLRPSTYPNVNVDEGDPSNAPGSHPVDLLFLRRTLDSAVSCLLDPREEVSLSAIQFLASVLTHCDASTSAMVDTRGAEAEQQQQPTQNLIVEEVHSRIQPSIVSTLMVGCVCGKINRSVLVEGCLLLQRAIPSVVSSMDDFEALIMHGAGGVGGDLSEHFWLGDDALRILLAVCGIILAGGNGTDDHAVKSVPQSKFLNVLTELWGLHQSDTPEALAGSDGVQAFVRKYY